MIALHRRIAVSTTALLIAASLFHANVAAAVVTRADDFARAGDRVAAVTLYRRALALDPGSTVAADRLAFTLVSTHRTADARAALVATTAALERAPHAAELLADRAWAHERLHQWRAAEDDFAQAGILARDARYDHLAARCAQAARRPRDARRLFALALVHDPAFSPARAALAGLR